MSKKLIFIGGLLFLFTMAKIHAQIYSQGKNINNENVFYVEIELVPKPRDPGKFHASIDFYGQRNDVKWFLKEGPEHKAFTDQTSLIAYMSDKGWIFLGADEIGSNSVGNRVRYAFRKSMFKLYAEYLEQSKANE